MAVTCHVGTAEPGTSARTSALNHLAISPAPVTSYQTRLQHLFLSLADHEGLEGRLLQCFENSVVQKGQSNSI